MKPALCRGIQASTALLSRQGIFGHCAVIHRSMTCSESLSPATRAAGWLRPMAEQVKSRSDSDALSAFEGEVLPHADRLFRLAMWFERNHADAEDVVQDTLIQALKSFHRFEPGTNCRAWLTMILRRIVSNRRRAKGRSIVVSDPDDRIAETVPFIPPVPDELTDELVLGALRRLPEALQEIIVLCDLEDLSYKEAAEALEVPIGTVMSRLHRGRARLRAELAAAEAVPVGERSSRRGIFQRK
jgi:RNA polymerase sigma-70 factor (ECF subfamily)